MQPPDELMVNDFLPALRHLVAGRLRGRGYSQNKISEMLGVTQASVSNYLSSEPGKAYSTLASLSVGREDADRYAALLAEDVSSNRADGVETLRGLWTSLLGRGLICDAHRRLYPSLSDCDVCMRAYGVPDLRREEAIADVASAVGMVESSPFFVEAMPEVSVNIARVGEGSASPEDVVAVPGRIVRVKDRPKAILAPEFGASRHMARVLLAVRRKKRDFRASINLRYDARMKRVIRKMGLRALEVGRHAASGKGDPTVEALASALQKGIGDFDVVVDLGGEGIEPNLYLFGRDAKDATALAIQISRLYSAG